MKVSAIIPAVSNFFLDRSIQSVLHCCDEIVLVKARKFEFFKNVNDTIINNEKIVSSLYRNDLNCPEAKNLGASMATGDYLLFLDQDAMLFDGCIGKMIECFEHDNIGIVGPAQLNMTTHGLRELTGKFTFNDPGYCVIAEKSGFVDAVSGFCMLIREEAFNSLCGFNESYIYGGDDIEFCFRAKQKGWRTYLRKEAQAFHCIGSGLGIVQDEKNSVDIKDNVDKLRNLIIPKKNKIDHKNILHVLGLAHTRANPDYSYCAFTSLTRTFCSMMRRRGYHVKFYGVEGSQVDCDEFVQCLSNQEFLDTYKDNENHKLQYKFNWEDGAAWPTFAANAERELRERIKDEKEIVCVAGGGYHRFALGVSNAICIDPHVGHKAPITNYRVFASKTWRAFVYGLFDKQFCEQHYPPPYWYDAVIYHYLNLDDFEFKAKKQDYAVFIGRLNHDKGVYDAMKACAEIGIKIKIAGANHPATEPQFKQALQECSPYAEYIGTVKAKDKSKLLSNAKCVICTSYYNEPFGLVAIEAMACGTPIITTDWGAFAETNIHGVTGYRCSTFQDIKNALKMISNIDPKKCREWVEKNFTDTVASMYYDQYFKKIHKIESKIEIPNTNPWYSADAGIPIIQDFRN